MPDSLKLRVKICGITKPDQGLAIARLGASALGFICVPASARYVSPQQIKAITQVLPDSVATVGVFADATLETIQQTVAIARLSGIQLHGNESPQLCQHLRQILPSVELIKAIRVQTPAMLAIADDYAHAVNTLLLDAYDPQQLGGTGKTIDWSMLQDFSPSCPWLLAGGLTPENIGVALRQLQPNGIDLSSSVEQSPGDKDLNLVQALFERLASIDRQSATQRR